MRTSIKVSGIECAVEPLSVVGLSHHSRTNSPKAQVNAPEGYCFSGGESSLCIHTAKDLDAIERTEALALCDVDSAPVVCEAFLRCTNLATTHIPNVVLGQVPACDHCANWFKGMQS